MSYRCRGRDCGSKSLLMYTTKGQLRVLICYVYADLQQDTEVSEEKAFRASYERVLYKSDFGALKTISVEIKCYRNRKKEAPAWIDLDPCA